MKKVSFLFLILSTLIPQLHGMGAVNPPPAPMQQGPAFGPQAPGAPGINGPINPFTMTEDEALKLQEQVDLEIAKIASTLPPEEQDKFVKDFYKEVEEISNYMSTLSEDELVKFLEDAFITPEMVAQPELIQQGPAAQVMPAIEPVAEPSKKETDAKKEEKTEDINKAIKMLNNIITRAERFLRKAQQIPELSGKIEQWISQDKVREWQAGLTWSTLKADTEYLVQQLYTIKDSVDPKTKKPRHISELLKNESLYNNLNSVSKKLTTHEPNVQAPELGLGTVSKESRTAIKDVLGVLAEAIYTLDLSTELDTLIEQFEPRAKTLREEEEKTRKTAFEESKKQPTPGARREVGTTKAPYTPSAQYPDYTGGGYYPTTPYTPSYDVGGYKSPYDVTGLEGTGVTPMPGRTVGGGPAGLPGTETDAEKAGEKGASEKDKTPGKKEEKEEKAPEDVKADKQLKNIDGALTKIIETFEEKPLIVELEKHIFSTDPVDIELATQDIPLNLTKNFTKAAREVKAFKSQLNTLSTAQKNQYTKKMRSLVNAYKDEFKKLDDQLGAISSPMKQSQIAVDKRYAYFGDEKEKAAAIKMNPALKDIAPANISKLQQALKEWQDATREYVA